MREFKGRDKPLSLCFFLTLRAQAHPAPAVSSPCGLLHADFLSVDGTYHSAAWSAVTHVGCKTDPWWVNWNENPSWMMQTKEPGPSAVPWRQNHGVRHAAAAAAGLPSSLSSSSVWTPSSPKEEQEWDRKEKKFRHQHQERNSPRQNSSKHITWFGPYLHCG